MPEVFRMFGMRFFFFANAFANTHSRSEFRRKSEILRFTQSKNCIKQRIEAFKHKTCKKSY